MDKKTDLRRVFVQVDIVGQGDDFLVVIVTAGRANVMRALEFAAIGAFVRVNSNQCIMRTTVVAARFGYFVLLDSHVSTFV